MKLKQVILIRRDLKMRRGKEIAQGSHAALEFVLTRLRASLDESGAATITLSADERAWMRGGMAKVCLRVNSEAELVEHFERARGAGLESHLITDSGKTEFAGVATLTACAIGPAKSTAIDQITGDLVPY